MGAFGNGRPPDMAARSEIRNCGAALSRGDVARRARGGPLLFMHARFAARRSRPLLRAAQSDFAFAALSGAAEPRSRSIRLGAAHRLWLLHADRAGQRGRPADQGGGRQLVRRTDHRACARAEHRADHGSVERRPLYGDAAPRAQPSGTVALFNWLFLRLRIEHARDAAYVDAGTDVRLHAAAENLRRTSRDDAARELLIHELTR